MTHAAITTDGTDVFIAGGYPTDDGTSGQAFATAEAFRYDVAADTYEALPDLPEARASGALGWIDGRLYFVGGVDITRDVPEPTDHWMLDLADPAAGWSPVADLPAGRNHLGWAVIDGLFYVTGGDVGQDSGGVSQDETWVYDPNADAWTSLAPLPLARGHISGATFELEGRMVVAGGLAKGGGGSTARVDAYDPATDSWSRLTDLPGARNNGVADEVGDGVWVYSTGSGGGTTTTIAQPVRDAADSSATLAITPGGGINASTFGSGSFALTNEGSGVLASVRLDLTSALLPDLVFDPDGTAGDTTAKPLSIDSGGSEAGFLEVAYLEENPDANGFGVMELTFDDFEAGETVTFSVDADPTSIEGTSAPGPNESGSVSGLELVGSTITATLTDGSTIVGDVVPDGSDGGGVAALVADPDAAPSAELVGVSTPATVTDEAQTLRVTGQPGTSVEVVRVLGGLFGSELTDVDPFEANSATGVELLTATIGSGGSVDVPVTLTRNDDPLAELNHLAVSAEVDGVPSRLSGTLVVELGTGG